MQEEHAHHGRSSVTLRGYRHYPQGIEPLDTNPQKREDIYMNNNKKRAQAPKRFNRHESKQMSKRELSGFGMKAPRYERSNERLTVLSFEA